MGEGIVKPMIVITLLVAAVIGSVIYIRKSKRENMITELQDRLGLDRAQLESKSNEELEAMLASVNGK